MCLMAQPLILKLKEVLQVIALCNFHILITALLLIGLVLDLQVILQVALLQLLMVLVLNLKILINKHPPELGMVALRLVRMELLT